MSDYQVLYSDPAKNIKPIVVRDSTVNTQDTSISLVGANFPGYGKKISENLVHMLENFSSSAAPLNPLEGQLWFDTSDPNKKVLRVNDGGSSFIDWPPVNGVWQQSNTPINAKSGDIWVDTANNQLSIYNGFNFTLIGPDYSGATRTGSYSSAVADIFNNIHNVIINYVDGQPIEIIALESFTPNPVINGFSDLKPGLNMSGANVGTYEVPVYPKINGVADEAYNLRITYPTSQTVTADTFLRKDIDQRMQGALQIAKDDNSLKIGVDPTFILERRNSISATLLNTLDDGEFTFNVIDGGVTKRVVIIKEDSFNHTQRVGINITGYPTEDLDVRGGAKFGGLVTFTNTASVEQSYSASTNTSLTRTLGPTVQIYGGMFVEKEAKVKGVLTVQGQHILTGKLTIGTVGISGGSTAIEPFSSGIYNIGASTSSWLTVYAQTFQADVNYNGGQANFKGTADRATILASAREVHTFGDIVSTVVQFNGSDGIRLNTTASGNLIYTKTTATITQSTDVLLVYRPSSPTEVTGAGSLLKTSKATFLSDVNYNSDATYGVGSLVPTGTILPFAGSTSTNISSPGWVVCDGSLKDQTIYSALFNTIRYTYGGSAGLGQFRVPNISASLQSVTETGTKNIYYIIKT
jgi:hypothetical protein